MSRRAGAGRPSARGVCGGSCRLCRVGFGEGVVLDNLHRLWLAGVAGSAVHGPEFTRFTGFIRDWDNATANQSRPGSPLLHTLGSQLLSV
jgi:hypothetical protein